ncbi:DUF2149 domain-containing protein [Aeromicrobium sp. SMF47]|uniref:DUF2149 domain-containing protein n=1 Tax=Aeromicrobium yanjiei TaxID=2662028 RepID=A0A5Q2MGW7_9ACTN|nr:DUF2149 domain-containing protein [Aeromicrobium yanjiei]MRJ76435.1 DUF2149 domain-containing protein [Aeromicrobium yanjiei]QGG42394.1 DUF2149 domain-containing protein [Aeromicrobium yanjiei]
MIKVTPRARVHQDKAGDPLDGLVNMFDIGIVLAVGFLIAALSSLGLSGAVNEGGLTKPALGEVTVKPGETVEDVPDEGVKTVGRGTPVGTVYRLADGRLVYVTGDGTAAPVSPGADPTDPTSPADPTAPADPSATDDVPSADVPDIPAP